MIGSFPTEKAGLTKRENRENGEKSINAQTITFHFTCLDAEPALLSGGEVSKQRITLRVSKILDVGNNELRI